MNPHFHTVFDGKFLTGNSYRSPAIQPDAINRLLPSLSFYIRLFLGPVRRLCSLAAKGRCNDTAWVHASVQVAEIIEQTGCLINVQGMQAITATDGPCLFVANHMSTLETFMLPGIIRPRRPVTFVVKKSLATMPFFGAVMRSRDPIVIERADPSADLTTVLEGGIQRLNKGISIIIFPQSTRSAVFDARHFNSIGIKLARRAQVPIVPLALKTDAWGQGKKIKELGKIRPELTVRYRFANPIWVAGKGKEEHVAICDYLAHTLEIWQKEDNGGS